ncbi:MAG: metal-dependent hydrolase [Pseudomonadales bacterium]
MSELTVRNPAIEFEQSLPHWNPSEPEFSQINNAASTVLPHLEPYLIKVLRLAKEELREELQEDRDKKLRDDIDLFIRQEANHYKLHRRYNETLYANGYDGLKDHERVLADDYRSFLSERSLKFNVAYCEGFESLGLIQAEFMFNHAGHWLKDADEAVRSLWEWHLAEEYEHRRVCYDVYKRLYGGYFYRLYGLIFAIRHLEGYGKRTSKFLIKQDRQQGAIRSGARSWWRETRYRVRLSSFGLFKLCRTLSPFYNPSRLKVPEAIAKRLASDELLTAPAL